jgi:hypothetical protein
LRLRTGKGLEDTRGGDLMMALLFWSLLWVVLLVIVAVGLFGGILLRTARILELNVQEADAHELVPPVVLVNAHASNDYLPTVTALTSQGLDRNHLLVVVGGCAEDGVEAHPTHLEIRVSHNSFDYTALIGVLEHREAVEALRGEPLRAVFLMHVTCTPGPLFLRRLRRNFRASTTRLLSPAWSFFVKSMNMGIYSLDDLEAMSAEILAIKARPTTDAERQRVKMTGFKHEDMIFEKRGVKTCLNLFCSLYAEQRVSSVAKDGLPRARLHFPALDLDKFQAHSVIGGGPLPQFPGGRHPGPMLTSLLLTVGLAISEAGLSLSSGGARV